MSEEELSKLRTDSLELLLKNAAKFMDLGLFYLPLVREAGEYNGYRKRGSDSHLTFDDKTMMPDAPKSPEPGEEENKTAEELFTEFWTQSLSKSRRQKTDSLSPAVYTALTNLVVDKWTALRQLRLAYRRGEPYEGVIVVADDSFSMENLTKIGETERQRVTKTITNLASISQLLANRRQLNKAVSLLDKQRFAFLEGKLNHPELYLKQLYERSGHVVRKVVGDFYFHMQFFKPEFYKALSESGEMRKRLLLTVLTDPLKADEVRIGNPLKQHLRDDYKKFIELFYKAIEANLDAWTGEAFKH
jgi:hypothetical protein